MYIRGLSSVEVVCVPVEPRFWYSVIATILHGEAVEDCSTLIRLRRVIRPGILLSLETMLHLVAAWLPRSAFILRIIMFVPTTV